MTATTPSSELPPHHSPVLAPTAARPSSAYLKEWTDLQPSGPQTPAVPGLLSPQFTPPATPGTATPSRHLTSEPKSTPVDTSLDDPSIKQPRLVSRLPHVECVVRARIPTTSGAEMFLHLYQNDSDNKEHLAIVFGNTIRSKSLDAERPGETEMDRMIRGAYVGRLRPGRVSSRVDNSEAGNVKKQQKLAGKGRVRAASSALRNVETPETLVEGEELDTTRKQEELADQQQQQQQQQQQTPPAQHTPTTLDSADPLANSLDSLSLSLDNHQHHYQQQQQHPFPTTKPPLVRIHSECYTGETAWSARCDCGEQLDEAARLMSLPSSTEEHGGMGGVIVYLRQEGRGIGLASKLKAYNLQDLGNDTVEANLLLRHPADARTYGLATAILCDLGLGRGGSGGGGEEDGHAENYNIKKVQQGLGISSVLQEEGARDGQDGQGQGQGQEQIGIRLLTNNPDKVRAVEGPNKEVRVRERVAMVPLAWRTGGTRGVKGVEIERYLDTKIRQMGHMIHE